MSAMRFPLRAGMPSQFLGSGRTRRAWRSRPSTVVVSNGSLESLSAARSSRARAKAAKVSGAV